MNAKKSKLLTYEQLLTEKGIVGSRKTLSRKMELEQFPKCVRISSSRIAWHEHEIDAYIANLQRGHADSPRVKSQQKRS